MHLEVHEARACRGRGAGGQASRRIHAPYLSHARGGAQGLWGAYPAPFTV
jgi:hypothetical protein